MMGDGTHCTEGQQLRYCGVGAGFDDVIIDGDLDAMKFVAYYVKKGTVVAVARFVFPLIFPLMSYMC